MREQGTISQAEYEAAVGSELTLSSRSIVINQYVNSCIAEAREILMKDKSEIFGEGYQIGTYFDDELQSSVDGLIANHTVENG